jgi:hypothetical protein
MVMLVADWEGVVVAEFCVKYHGIHIGIVNSSDRSQHEMPLNCLRFKPCTHRMEVYWVDWPTCFMSLMVLKVFRHT